MARLKLTVPIAEAPFVTEFGETAKEDMASGGGVIVNIAVFLELFSVAVMVTSVGEVTVLVLMEKLPDVERAFTITLTGSVRGRLGTADNCTT